MHVKSCIAGVAALLVQRRHHVEPVAVLEPQVDDGEGRRRLGYGGESAGHGVGNPDNEATLLHRPLEPGEEGFVVIDQ